MYGGQSAAFRSPFSPSTWWVFRTWLRPPRLGRSPQLQNHLTSPAVWTPLTHVCPYWYRQRPLLSTNYSKELQEKQPEGKLTALETCAFVLGCIHSCPLSQAAGGSQDQHTWEAERDRGCLYSLLGVTGSQILAAPWPSHNWLHDGCTIQAVKLSR